MKVLSQPDLAQLVVAYIKQWKVHSQSVASCPYLVNFPALSLGMSQGFFGNKLYTLSKRG